MKIGLLDLDNMKHLDNCYPNLPIMKLSTWHKKRGNDVEWYNPETHYDCVFISKVFSFTKELDEPINADMVIRGGSGYAIKLVDGKEVYRKEIDVDLPDVIEHQYPDYDLYGIKDTAYGFMSRGCPRGCFFCHVKDKEGRGSYKVADLSEFWKGQSTIELMDPNTLACKDRLDILKQLSDSKAKVEFNQGLDIRLMTDDVIEIMNNMKLINPHFAWDRYQDKKIIVPKFESVAKKFNVNPRQISVYCLTNYDTTLEQDLERVMTLRSLGYSPYIMRYDKEHLKRGHILNKLARWCNNRRFFWKYETFEDYLEANPH